MYKTKGNKFIMLNTTDKRGLITTVQHHTEVSTNTTSQNYKAGSLS